MYVCMLLLHGCVTAKRILMSFSTAIDYTLETDIVGYLLAEPISMIIFKQRGRSRGYPASYIYVCVYVGVCMCVCTNDF